MNKVNISEDFEDHNYMDDITDLTSNSSRVTDSDFYLRVLVHYYLIPKSLISALGLATNGIIITTMVYYKVI